MDPSRHHTLHGHRVVITRPSATAGALAARVRRLGGTPVRAPAMALLPPAEDAAVSAALREALAARVVIFTSPAAVRFAARRMALDTRAQVLTPGHATARALRRAGVAEAQVPARHDSEGMLQHPLLRDPHGKIIALVGAAGGRTLLADTLHARGARVREVHVYRRAPPRITRRHVDAIMALRPPFHVLLSSAQAVTCLQRAVPEQAWAQLCGGAAVCSSARVAAAATTAGFAQCHLADSAHASDLLAAVLARVR